nr:MAG TPA: hypothetical protein [Caudoviricetes sp.]
MRDWGVCLLDNFFRMFFDFCFLFFQKLCKIISELFFYFFF